MHRDAFQERGRDRPLGRAGAGRIASAVLACTLATAAASDESYRGEIRTWREDREARLRADGGWLTVAGLFWLKDGWNTFGSGASCDIVLPEGSAPALAGAFDLAKGRTSVTLEPGVPGSIGSRPVTGPTELRPDSSGSPDALELGRLSLHVIERGGRLGIRLKDRESQLRRDFTCLTWFPIDERSRVLARFVPYDPPKALEVPNVLGRSENMSSPGRAEFTIDGTPLHLDGVLEEPDAAELFFIFRDQTSGNETYGAGRFLHADLPKDGELILDFNKAYNPPCAFTPYATCPLPPPQNRLPVRIEAGEKAYGHGH
jgi:uncharacterized protein (DUF1684 family)